MTLLSSIIFGCNGRPCSFIPSNKSNSIGTRVDGCRIENMNNERHNNSDHCTKVRIDFPNTFNGRISRSNRSFILCRMNKNRSPYINNDADDQSDKRGLARRLREKISTTFSGIRNEDDSITNEQTSKAPTPLDAVRLRLAKAMSGLSNLDLFQFMKEEWVVACPKTRVGPGQIIPCTINGLDIIIFASRDGQRLDAFANSCPHLGSPFDLGTIERKPVTTDNRRRKKDDGTGDGCVDCIVCPVHQTAFEIQSGQVQGEWCPYPPLLGGIMGFMKSKNSLVKFAVRLRGKNVEVRYNQDSRFD